MRIMADKCRQCDQIESCNILHRENCATKILREQKIIE